MLPKPYRFHSRGGVRYTYQKGTILRAPALNLIFAPNTRHHQRFAVVVSKKICKSAVDRNRLRRRIYEALRLELPNFTRPQDQIFLVTSSTLLHLPFSDLRHLIHSLLSRSYQSPSTSSTPYQP